MQKLSSLYIINSFTDGFPSGQRGQTVNLLAMPSKVRILLHPLYSKLPGIFTWEFCCHTPKRFESFSIHYYSRAYSLWSFSVIHQSDSNPSPSTISPERICSGVFYPSSLYQQRSALIPNFLFPPGILSREEGPMGWRPLRGFQGFSIYAQEVEHCLRPPCGRVCSTSCK